MTKICRPSAAISIVAIASTDCIRAPPRHSPFSRSLPSKALKSGYPLCLSTGIFFVSRFDSNCAYGAEPPWRPISPSPTMASDVAALEAEVKEYKLQVRGFRPELEEDDHLCLNGDAD